MPSAVRSLRQEQRELSARLRSEHKTWPEIAAVFQERYHVNVRAALRMVRDWSQRDAADQWNNRWPADLKTFKNFSYWELWPSQTGHAPSLDVLARLAELYECSLADLVHDCADFRSRDSIFNQKRDAVALSTELSNLITESGSGSAGDGHHSSLSNLMNQLDSIDVHEFARRIASQAAMAPDGVDRRSLLLKISAGLSLAAASPTLSYDIDVDAHSRYAGSDDGLSGIWLSRYVYTSTGRNQEFVDEHYVVVRQQGSRLIGQSLPHTTGSRLRLDLALDTPIATGTWREDTSPTGYYEGASYHGTLQLIVEPNGRRMRGMWLGFGREFSINSGQWELFLKEKSTDKTAQRMYHLKA